MILSQRERYAAIGTAAAVVILVADLFVVEPYLSKRAAIASDLREAADQKGHAADLFVRQPRLRRVWSEMRDGGLKADASQAETQALHALVDWAQASGVNVVALKPERSAQEGKFQVIGFSMNGTGTLASVSRLLWALESATIPVRVNELQITPRREGADDLTVQLGVSTLCQLPEAEQSKSRIASSGGGGATP